MSDETQLTVVDNPGESRFDVRLADGTVVGSAYYEREPGVVIFTHTEVDPSMEGKGVGSRLAAGALGLAREAGDRIVPLCPFIRAYVKKHPEYEDLVLHPHAGT
ncbi:GNAT family N-acetyltransferase [Antribacter gilvus]|uniref:GNAT family N-acetyltransferase n=1 Tax=Antribacter gilvus TaxID=2304675 RepID=UPI000F7B53B2|nr:GNAT family N-acetyltransferase [Antribacter gilvus]